ncbi:MAG: hypothetical protein JSU65_14150 [Candidatus Zixiibacteriota bacterium]|nr:MAG: hypothetical protein JSU65_14150 [candidate division Zixibacteria bacterium]
MKSRTAILLLAVSLLSASAMPQQADLASLREKTPTNLFGTRPSFSPSSLLDASRMRWSHSYSFSFFSGGGTSGSLGLLRSTMYYDLSEKLGLSLNLGVLHNPGALWSDSPSNDAVFLPGFTLDYHPSERFRMSLSVQRVSGYFYPVFSPYSSHRDDPTRLR